MPKEKSCGAIVFRRVNKSIKYLLLHYEAGHWDFPKGNQEKKEDEKMTVSREVREETGIEDIKFIDGFRESINYYYKKDAQVIYKEVTFYLIETNEEEVTISYEHIGYAWMNYERAYKRLTFNTSKDLLRKVNHFLYKKMAE
ncbi:NUDIX domain-containing protein [Candidatus Woesearchaeota archaeon]|nr:NUDIX domain-containing protein [Candidatus Woesearchaeota archaeon]